MGYLEVLPKLEPRRLKAIVDQKWETMVALINEHYPNTMDQICK